jgi:type II secretory pathway pseudopilin PulG
MNIYTKKIKAFTLNEMLVVLLITSLVVGMAFSVLRLVQQQMDGLTHNYERNTELNLLRQSLWIDFNQCDGVWYDAPEQKLLFVNELKRVTYQFQGDYVIKERDTFFIPIDEKRIYFDGEHARFGEIDALDLRTSQEGGRRIFVFKRNSSTSYINQ